VILTEQDLFEAEKSVKEKVQKQNSTLTGD
jgi:hypothetical protein